MHITMIAFGTRGDVQPALALGKGLAARGHTVRVLASGNFAAWITEHGLEAAHSAIDMQTVMASEDGLEWIEHGNHPVRQNLVMKRLLKRMGDQLMQEAWQASADTDLLLSSFTSLTYADAIAHKRGIPHAAMMLQPMTTATRDGRAMFVAPRPRQASWLNYAFGKAVVEPFQWDVGGALANRFRRDTLGLPAQTRRGFVAAQRALTVVHGYSPQIVPPPADWPANYHTTGPWFLDESTAWQPPDALAHFITAGPPPIAIGFGSMTGRDPAALTRLLLDAIQRSGQRAVLLGGWANVGESALPPTIFSLAAAPHAWLYPRMAAVVHHGGAGTTAAALRAGVPQVIVPHLGDQPFWGRRIAELGAGTAPLPRHTLTAEKLAHAIRHATSAATLKQRASMLGQAVRRENGVGNAVALIEALVAGR